MTTADRIAAVARELLTTEGADAVSMRRVATAVGITPMAIYRHFPDRDALVATVADAAFADLAADWATHPQPEDPRARLALAAEVFVDFALAQPHLYRCLFTDRRAEARRFPDDFRAGASPTLNLLISALADGMAGGVFRPDEPWAVALTLVAQVQGLIQLHQGGRIGATDDQFRALVTSSLERTLHGILA